MTFVEFIILCFSAQSMYTSKVIKPTEVSWNTLCSQYCYFRSYSLVSWFYSLVNIVILVIYVYYYLVWQLAQWYCENNKVNCHRVSLGKVGKVSLCVLNKQVTQEDSLNARTFTNHSFSLTTWQLSLVNIPIAFCWVVWTLGETASTYWLLVCVNNIIVIKIWLLPSDQSDCLLMLIFQHLVLQ